MKINYIKTVGFRKFKKVFETELYDITNITGRNRAGKTNILFAIINIMLGSTLSGDEKYCLINKNCDASYGELHFTDNKGIKHILIRCKDRYNNKKNILTLDGKKVTQLELTNFYKDKKLFLSIINPLFFLRKKPSEQKELIDKYLADIRPKVIFDRLNKEQQEYLIKKYFYIPIKDVYHKLSNDELKQIYNKNILNIKENKIFNELSNNEKKEIICKYISSINLPRFFEMLSSKEQEDFVNYDMKNIIMDISYNSLSKEEQKLLEGVPNNIPTYITELNENLKNYDKHISLLNGKIEYAQNFINQKVPEIKVFDKQEELSLARQELSFLMSNEDIIKKENQKQIVETFERDLLNKETEYKELSIKMKTGKKIYYDIKNSKSCICPMCEQEIQDESIVKTLTNMKNELTSDYDKYNLLETQIKDLKLKLAVEKCKYHSLQGNTIIDKSKRIETVEANIKQLEKEQQEIQNSNNQIENTLKLINNAKIDIKKFQKEKQAYLQNIEGIKETKKVAQKLYILYIEEKLKLVKQYLKDVDIKFYSVLKTTGEIKEDFIITYQNKTLEDLSTSERMATALEFANMFNKISQSNFPIFIDDYESCVDYDFVKMYSKNNQIITSKVVKGHALKISDANSNKCKIIKTVISNYKTIKIYNKNVTNIKKVA